MSLGIAAYQGLFGYVLGTAPSPVVIQNLTMASGSIRALENAGAIAAWADYLTLSNCKNAVTVTGAGGTGRIGGLAGGLGSVCVVENCSNSATVSSVSGAGLYTGGIVGSSQVSNVGSDYSYIRYCFNTGTITGVSNVGGIAGTNSGNLTIKECYNKAQITAANMAAGGIVGYGYGLLNVLNCYNTGLVHQGANVANAFFGGILGYPGGNIAGKYFTAITNCYTVGNVTVIGTGSVKEAIAGSLSGGGSAGGTGAVVNCHYLSTLAVTNTNGGTSQSSGTLQSAGFITTINNSQSPSIWGIDDIAMNGGYPVLLWQRLAAPTTINAAASISSSGFTASWSTVASASSYDVKVYAGASLISTTNANGQATASLVITGLTPNTTYTYTVTAKGDGVNTFDSYASTASASFTTLYVAVTVNGPGTTNVSTLTTNADVTVAAGATLAIDAAKSIHNLTVATGAKVDFDLVTPYTLTVTGNVVFQSDKTTSFSTNLGAGGMNVTGNVSYVKTMDNLQWYFMAFPCAVNVDNITKSNGTPFNLTTELFIRSYDGAGRVTNLGATSNWIPVTAGSTLAANHGYIFGIANGIGPFDVTFPLAKSVVISEPAQDVSVTAYGSALSINASHKGWNLVGQPYLSNYTGSGSNVALMTFFEEGYYYATYAKADVTAIAPFRAFFVQADAALETSKITFALAQRQTVHAAVRNELSDNVRITVATATGVDHTDLIIDPQRTVDYEIGQDMVKWLTMGTSKPQLYSTIGTTKFSFNALPLERVQNLPLGLYSNSAGSSTISADLSAAPGISQLVLTDHVTGISTDLATSDYHFDASSGSVDNRFTVSARAVSTANLILGENSKVVVKVLNDNLLIDNIVPKTDIQVCDLMGRLIVHEINPNNSFRLPLLQKGVYTVRMKNGDEITVCKVVNP